jgi:hypothetical protein
MFLLFWNNILKNSSIMQPEVAFNLITAKIFKKTS